MVKKDFIKLYAEKYNTNEETAKENIENVFDLIKFVLSENEYLKIKNFGVFEMRETKERNIVDPKDGSKLIHARPRKYIKFRGSRNIEKELFK